ncbi:MAG TPA: hypothetical protein DCS12_06135 [Clostridiales bacterium]|nr:hypothetical protein [Clostridiales bacterium]
MSGKTTIVFDTNFIIDHKTDLLGIHEKLSENYDLYITEVSINERISQKYMEFKSKHEKIEAFIKEYSSYANITLRYDFDKIIDNEKKRTFESYQNLFDDRIISLNSSENILQEVLERVYEKVPPFSDSENASDKGFKDTLIWLSIMKFFNNSSKDINVIFLTNDKGFLKYTDKLKKEFFDITGNTIEIKDNNYYKILLGETEHIILAGEKESVRNLSNIDIYSMRDRIDETINSICGVYVENYWGEEHWERTFTTNAKFEPEYVKVIFDLLKEYLENHIFDKQVSASSIFTFNGEIEDINPILMESVESAYELYEEIKTKYPEYMEPFINTVCDILNNNFVAETLQVDEDDEIPF